MSHVSLAGNFLNKNKTSFRNLVTQVTIWKRVNWERTSLYLNKNSKEWRKSTIDFLQSCEFFFTSPSSSSISSVENKLNGNIVQVFVIIIAVSPNTLCRFAQIHRASRYVDDLILYSSVSCKKFHLGARVIPFNINPPPSWMKLSDGGHQSHFWGGKSVGILCSCHFF